MSEAAGNVKRSLALGAELDGHVLQVGLALRPQIHDHIEDCAVHAPYELRFGGWRILEMHASERTALDARGHIRLCDVGLQSQFLEFLLAEDPREEAPIIRTAFSIDDEGAFEFWSR